MHASTGVGTMAAKSRALAKIDYFSARLKCEQKPSGFGYSLGAPRVQTKKNSAFGTETRYAGAQDVLPPRLRVPVPLLP